ncbi:MAG: VIT1/CCC1 transporter family protein [Spirochaetales bacterium]|nr:VIT1/CCC1 transporter family protein [Spirochaetales bacterium]
MDKKLLNNMFSFQKSEITEYHIYLKLAKSMRNEKNCEVLNKIAADEKAHYDFWKKQTNTDVKPDRLKIFFFFWITKLFGLTFGIKLMEKGEDLAHDKYAALADQVPDVMEIAEDEDIHEKALIDLIEEEKLKYIGSVVLGLNDALVELTGALAGLTFALQNTRLIALAGLITGIAASFSMAASEYLSKKHDGEDDDALKSSIYTGIAYIVTVALLITPYLVLSNYLFCLAVTLLIAIFIIFIFNYYISVAMDMPFRQRFLEMSAISLGVSLFSFGIGWLVRSVLGVDV